MITQVLEKTYVLEAEDDIVPKAFSGCKISWKSVAQNVTVEESKKRVKGPKVPPSRGGGTGGAGARGAGDTHLG